MPSPAKRPRCACTFRVAWLQQVALARAATRLSIGQSIKARQLFGPSSLRCRCGSLSVCSVPTMSRSSWATRCCIATPTIIIDISKLCCNAVHLLPWPTRCCIAWSSGRTLAGHGDCSTWPSTELLVCNICISMLCVFSQLRVTAFAA